MKMFKEAVEEQKRMFRIATFRYKNIWWSILFWIFMIVGLLLVDFEKL